MHPAIRMATLDDAAALLKIYKPYVENTALTFECEAPALVEFAGRIRDISATYPYLVCEISEEIIGYAYAHRHKERAAYQWNAELSVYIAPAFHRRRIGAALYGCLLDILRLQRVQNVYGVVSVPNPASETLHVACGFTKEGVYKETGYKFGAWRDIVTYINRIGNHENNPPGVIPITKIHPHEISAITQKYTVMIKP
ncbi:MAG: GNAT family N-acetyltransferase [Clostridiales bacterium]|jgi:phosphinothricin acetyltransferase|nr:GNAT family N-acetyltransferase [Clostridiales bacterium]